MHRGNPQAKVIAWDWGWHGHGDAPEMIAALPKLDLADVGQRMGRCRSTAAACRAKVGEYSLSAVGPGPRATPPLAAGQAGRA